MNTYHIQLRGKDGKLISRTMAQVSAPDIVSAARRMASEWGQQWRKVTHLKPLGDDVFLAFYIANDVEIRVGWFECYEALPPSQFNLDQGDSSVQTAATPRLVPGKAYVYSVTGIGNRRTMMATTLPRIGERLVIPCPLNNGDTRFQLFGVLGGYYVYSWRPE